MNNKDVIEFNGESCSWCDNDKNCDYKKSAMEGTREVAKGLSACTSAYCSIKVECDYYEKDVDKYNKYNVCDRVNV